MSEEKRIEQRVLKTLHSLAALEDIDTHPFLQSLLQAQIGEYEASKARPGYLRFHRRDLRPTLLLLLIVFNILSIVCTLHYQTEHHEHSLTAFAQEYVFTQNSMDVEF